ncbi:aminotransferase class I/II-fold pyridoxal phosphate-dependent enzyme [Bacillus cereus]|uniref:aminotransferase class I/II-fold pyridoxal phosphate-dependent enzyme n=1 Tax=Bacillus cereus TaxID=1396 RepID=UPI000279CD54|nr:aminotransferase class I/II-fold pyridoxal phosphate-dependent enzyme [Bacillus cereus]EJR91889.1 hypothetical protein IKG_05683 [Bacillus cereus VD200]
MDTKILKHLLLDDIKPNHLMDTKFLQNHLELNLDYEPIPLALGETWGRVPKRLTEYLGETEPYESGYQISMYGLPSFRKSLKKHIFTTEKVSPQFGNEIEVGVTWSGTKSSMIDFGRYMLDKTKKKNLTPIFLTTDPDWDYEGAFLPLGFKARKVLLDPKNNFVPSIEDFQQILKEIERNEQEFTSFIIINAQHNPTGNNWSEELVEGIIQLSIQYQCGLLIDNAYYGSTSDRNPTKTSTLAILEKNWNIIVANGTEDLIFGVRSLGKQFHCNGWGIGAIWAAPRTLDKIVNEYRVIHTFNYNAIFQKAMEKWIESEDSKIYLENLYLEKKRKDDFLKNNFLEKLQYPIDSLHVGEYCPYMIYEVPRKYQRETDSLSKYIEDLFYTAGILVTGCWSVPRTVSRDKLKEGHVKYVRMYTGVEEKVLQETLERMVCKGFTY